jgi:hypothetical protein
MRLECAQFDVAGIFVGRRKPTQYGCRIRQFIVAHIHFCCTRKSTIRASDQILNHALIPPDDLEFNTLQIGRPFSCALHPVNAFVFDELDTGGRITARRCAFQILGKGAALDPVFLLINGPEDPLFHVLQFV